MRRFIAILWIAAVAGCSTGSHAPLAKGKTKVEAIAAYGRPKKIITTPIGETWEYTNVLSKDSKGVPRRWNFLVISFDRSGKVMCWPSGSKVSG